MWIGMEINILSFIPLITNLKNINYSEAAINYFLIQALASSIILISINISRFKSNFSFYIIERPSSPYILISTIILKIGSAPFQFWIINVIENLNWINNLIIITLQKVAPITVTWQLIKIEKTILIFVITSVIIGALGGLNQISIRKIIAFSSLNQIGWIIITLLFNKSLWTTYIIIYSIVNTSVIILIHSNKAFFINQIVTSNKNSNISKIILATNLISIGGLPPMLGFIPKWIVVQTLIINKILLINSVMIIIRLITLFFYLKIRITPILIRYIELNWNWKRISNNWINHLQSINSAVSILRTLYVIKFILR